MVNAPSTLLQALAQRPLLGDGAMGTQLFAAGLAQGECGERWNLDHPERIEAIQRRYVEAGSDCLLTNTFGGCALALERHGLADQVDAINRAAVEIARRAFGERPGFVIGDIGPFGGLMEPLGPVKPDAVRAAFLEQARALVAAGADAIIIETQSALEELGVGIEAAREAGAPCIIGSMAYNVTKDGADYRTMMGVRPEKAAEFMIDKGVDILALNCGEGMEMTHAAKVIARYRQVSDKPTMAQPNAGKPVMEEGRLTYKATPEEMAPHVEELLNAGAGIIGACCGSTPDHIHAFRGELDRLTAGK